MFRQLRPWPPGVLELLLLHSKDSPIICNLILFVSFFLLTDTLGIKFQVQNSLTAVQNWGKLLRSASRLIPTEVMYQVPLLIWFNLICNLGVTRIIYTIAPMHGLSPRDRAMPRGRTTYTPFSPMPPKKEKKKPNPFSKYRFKYKPRFTSIVLGKQASASRQKRAAPHTDPRSQ
jgi:hypothetical protein